METKEPIAFMFDVDGVILNSPHEEAWKDSAVKWKLFDRGFDFRYFYQSQVAGIPGKTGAEKILLKFDSSYSDGTEQDKKERIKYFVDVKQEFLDEHIKEKNFRVFEDILQIIRASKKQDIPIATVSSSQNAEKMLQAIGVLDMFDSYTLGAKTHNANSKSQLYQIAFNQLNFVRNIQNHDTFVWEDADNGVRAAKDAGFYCIGVARPGLTTSSLLIDEGADLAYNNQDLSSRGFTGIYKDITKLLGDQNVLG